MSDAITQKQNVSMDEIPVVLRAIRVPTANWVVGEVGGAAPASPNVLHLEGNDMLYLLVDITLVGANPAEVRVEYSHQGDNALAAEWYLETALEPTALAAGVITTGVGAQVYQFTANGQYRIPLAVDDKTVRVSARTNGAPNAGDRIGIRAMRRIRDSLA